MRKPIVIAYYCSGHGYGHATRVSSFGKHLLELFEPPKVYIVSSAPTQAFSESIGAGALYRHAFIDAVISQPVAYRVDRKKSLAALQNFLSQRDAKIEEESQWLQENHVDVVLSDAGFLACAAAQHAGLPSALVTNFTFDSIWSYLSSSIIDPTVIGNTSSPADADQHVLEPDVPIPYDQLAPYVQTIVQDYRCADLLIRLPGCIPIPSFALAPSLPSTSWVDLSTRAFVADIVSALAQPVATSTLHPLIPFPSPTRRKPHTVTRQIVQAPLLVRHPSPDIYTPEGRRRMLSSIGIPEDQHDHTRTRILVVSFGGQIIRRPNGSRSVSRAPSPEPGSTSQQQMTSPGSSSQRTTTSRHLHVKNLSCPPRIATPSHIYIPGAPGPVSRPTSNPATPIGQLDSMRFTTVTRAASLKDRLKPPDISEDGTVTPTTMLLPAGWIAVVCDVGDAWGVEDMPDRFFVAPKGVYMPDMMAVGDVVLGKLGYGTVSECVDSCTPFVYVPRPLFIEEYGLRMLMQSQGVGVELSREEYEGGIWAGKVKEAWRQGRRAKDAKRNAGDDPKTHKDIDDMALSLLQWVKSWHE